MSISQVCIDDGRNGVSEIVALSPELSHVWVFVCILSLVLTQRIVEFFNEFAVPDLVLGIAVDLLIVKVHESLKVDPKFILISDHLCESVGDSGGERGDANGIIIKNHNYYL